MGWLSLGITFSLLWILCPHNVVRDWYGFHRQLITAHGKITNLKTTNFTSSESEVFAYHFEFRDSNGKSHTGISYGDEGMHEPGDAIGVEYRQDDPEIARINGMRNTLSGNGMILLIVIYQIVAMVIILIGLCIGIKGIRMLRNSKQAAGKLISVVPTNIVVNNNTVYKFTFEFTADDGRQYQVVSRTHNVNRFMGEWTCGKGRKSLLSFMKLWERRKAAKDTDWAKKAENKDIFEPLLYDPRNPSRAVMLDACPGQPGIDKHGRICLDDPHNTIWTTAIPMAVIIGHGYYFIYHVL